MPEPEPLPMIEVLALPGWQVAATPLTAWADQFASQGLIAVMTFESPGVSWIEVVSLRLRGYAVMNGRNVEAINFELAAADPVLARDALEQAAAALSWELHDDDDEDDSDDNDDDL